MITTPEEYLTYLWGIENNSKPALSIILPSEEKIYDIDLDTRTVKVPEYLSVAKDHNAETIYFKVDRYFEYQDLSKTSCIIEYINASGEGRIYPVPYYDIQTYKDDNKILLPWCIEGEATKTAGTVKFVFRFYKLDDNGKSFIYNLSTIPSSGVVLNGINANTFESDHTYDAAATLIEQLNYKLDQTVTTVYWTELV